MAMTKGQIYKCDGPGGCPMIVEVLEDCDCQDPCEMTCCGATMEKLEPKTADAATEKHVPVCEKVSGGYKVKVGSVPHPMESEHWIQWIEVTAGSKVYREYLKPGQDPEAVFPLDSAPDSAREYCNKHGLWKG